MPARQVAQALPGVHGARSAPRAKPGAEFTTSPAPRSAETNAVVSSRVKNPHCCAGDQLSARSGRMARSPWRRSDVLTSSGGAGTTPTATRYRRTYMAGARRLGGGASPGPAAGKATPGMNPPTGAGLVPGGPPCSPEWSTDPGATSADPEDDILTLVRDTLFLPFALDWDALPLCRLPPARPDLLQGTSWGLGMVGLVRGPTRTRCAPVEQDKMGGGGERTCGLALTRACTLLLALTPDDPRPSPDDPPPPRGPPTRGAPVGPGIGTDGTRARTPPPETRGTPKGRDEAPVGEPPGLARDGPR